MISETVKKIYSSEELSFIDLNCVPQHIAFIMDGNRRWAKRHGYPIEVGHWRGAEVLTQIVRAAAEIGVKVLTAYAFSTENWTRPQGEVNALMRIFERYLIEKRKPMLKEGVRFDVIGDLTPLPQGVREALAKTKEMTSHGDVIDLVLAVNYGGRDEIRRACLRAMDDFAKGKLQKENFTEEVFARYLDTAKWPDHDLLIRTSGETRVSNFLLWQGSYSEIYLSDILWPVFSERDFLDAIMEYQKRNRRLGG